MTLTALNGRQKRSNLADKPKYSSIGTVVLKQRILAGSAKITHTLAENTFCMIGFGRKDIGWYLGQLALVRNLKGREHG